ncbi:MAG: TlpA family protein disulfide reductase [Candidatus Omnitrophica bacterium]|nr:TlpA family protein disulfide reductase [Candidatus Omnitrophota bacterium]
MNRKGAWPLLPLLLLILASGCEKRNTIQTAPDFRLPSLSEEGKEVVLSEVLKEHPVLLVFWATWCPSCITEIPTLNKWNDEYEAAGLKILGINFREEKSKIAAFVKEQGIHYPVLMDQNGVVAERFGLDGLPATVFVDRNGKIIYFSFSLPHNMPALLGTTPKEGL